MSMVVCDYCDNYINTDIYDPYEDLDGECVCESCIAVIAREQENKRTRDK